MLKEECQHVLWRSESVLLAYIFGTHTEWSSAKLEKDPLKTQDNLQLNRGWVVHDPRARMVEPHGQFSKHQITLRKLHLR